MNTRMQGLAVGAAVLAASLAGGRAEPEAAPVSAVSNAPPVVLYLGSSLIGTELPALVTQLVDASTPPLAISPRYYLRGAHKLDIHWQRPSQPPKGGSLLSYLRYPDPPRPALPAHILSDWGERRPNVVILEASQQFEEEPLRFWVGLYRRAMVKRGIQPILFVAHMGDPATPGKGGFMFPFKDEAEGIRLVNQVNDACVRVSVEFDMEVAPAYLACYKVKRARPDLALDRVGTKDKGHAGPKGAYLEACVVYGALFNRSPEGLTVRLAPGAKPNPDLNESVHVDAAVLTDEEALFLQKTAWDSILEFRRLAAERKAAAAAGTVPALTPRPRVLLIGAPYHDAYRRNAETKWKQVADGYRSALRERVKAQTGVEVIFAPLGPCAAGEALVELDDWLGGRTWTLVAFGWGARELVLGIPPDEYEKNLRSLVSALKQNGSPLLWTGFLPVTRDPGVKPWTGERELDTEPNLTVAKDAGPLAAAAERVLKEHGLASDPDYAGNVAGLFAPEGRPAEARPVTREDWIRLGEWLADSLARHMPARQPAAPLAIVQ